MADPQNAHAIAKQAVEHDARAYYPTANVLTELGAQTADLPIL